MAQNTDLNVSPYYDDYDETKNFHRILFRPSNAIQARELTQLQSILQNQVEKFGNHIFDEGALVMGGTVTVNTLYEAVKVNAANPNGSGTATAETYRTASVGKYYQGQTSGVVAKVINTAAATSGGDPLTLYVTYVKANADTSTTTYSKFLDNEELQEVTLASDGSYSDASNNNEFKTILPSEVAGHTSATSTGSAATVRGGVFYTRGFFVRCDEQTILLDKYSNTPTYRIGLQITESLQSSTDDDSLLDNASGTSNENAPGANRLKIALTLVNKLLTGTQDIDNFIELSRVEAGTITKQTAITAYNSLERTLARRTHDESGDYVTKPFQAQLREHFNSKLNNGVYTSTDTPAGDKTKFITVLSAGKAYVKGYEVQKSSETFVTIDKARTTIDSGALAVPFEIGNYFTVKNAFGQPEFGTGDTADINPFGACELRDTAKVHPEGENGTVIGRARVRFYDATDVTIDNSSKLHTSDSQYRLHLFDVRMYTKLTVAASPSYALAVGQRIKGSVSGAKGIVAVTLAHGGTELMVHDVEGEFSTSDTIRLEQATTGGKAVSAVRNYSTDRVRQVSQASKDSNAAVFAADTVTTDNQFVLTGSVVGSATASTQTGVNTKFTQELKEGDVIVAPNGTSHIVSSVTSDTSIETASGANINGKYIRQRAQLQEQEKTVAIAATPKNFVSSITPNTLQIRKQKTALLSGATGSLSAATGETLFSDPSSETDNYIVTIHEADGTETNPEDNEEGRTISITEHDSVIEPSGSQGGAISISAANSTPLSNDDQVKVIYGVTKDVSSDNADKLLKRSRGVRITSTANATVSGTNPSGDVYGTNINDEIITLGVPDVYALRAVYESNDTSDALPPKLTLSSGMGTCNPGDKLSGSVTGAQARVIQKTGNDIYIYYLTPDITFTTDDTVTNEDNTNTSDNSRVCTAITVDSKDISGNWLLDTGQRDGYYGLGSIRRKPGAPTPQNRLLVIFDYFKSTGGSFFTVNSYSDLNFENIPTYSPNVVDPNGLEPDGEIELSDAVDFRSYCHSLHDLGTVLDPTSAPDVSEDITAQPFAYGTEEFTNTRAITFDLPKSGQSLLTSAMEHYVPRIDKLSLSSDGDFVISNGEPADQPAAPTTPSNSILLHTLYIPAYTADLSKVSVHSQDHKRFTMKDIGRIQGRVKNLERVSSLNALEQQTNLTQIQDADGLDRFKSGFVTDNFRGHKVGDVNHPDYKIGVDRTTGTLRPQHYSKFVDLSLNTGASSNYKQTGDMITLPFTEEAYVTINKASSTEFVNPYDVVLFNGTVTLEPSRDLWFDTERLPAVSRTVEGDYDTVLQGVENSLGTVWNNWQSDWLGEPVTTVEEPTNTTVTSSTPNTAQRGPRGGGNPGRARNERFLAEQK